MSKRYTHKPTGKDWDWKACPLCRSLGTTIVAPNGSVQCDYCKSWFEPEHDPHESPYGTSGYWTVDTPYGWTVDTGTWAVPKHPMEVVNALIDDMNAAVMAERKRCAETTTQEWVTAEIAAEILQEYGVGPRVVSVDHSRAISRQGFWIDLSESLKMRDDITVTFEALCRLKDLCSADGIDIIYSPECYYSPQTGGDPSMASISVWRYV